MSWIFYTIAATVLQTFRNLEQKNLNKKMDTLTVSWSRFILPLPFALVMAGYSYVLVSNLFIFYCLITAFFQIAGNIFLLKTIKSKNFGVGIAFYKTETLQAMVIGALFFSQTISLQEFIAIMIAMVGVILMSGLVFRNGRQEFFKSLANKATFFGLMSGFFFSVSAFSLKLASETLLPEGYSNLKASILVLMWVICFQNILFALVKSYQNRLMKDLKSLFLLENKGAFLKTSIFSFLGSVCWFTAYSLGKVVHVKAVGQIELVLAVLMSHFFLKESNKASELIGIALTSIGILMLIFSNSWHWIDLG